ncbi:hypothetical protein BSLG_008435 [Batrachochytrium salamandrivorans]|nr:hypothetical protein BASA83_000769 [Batrachochytrium salamandrivorans]KAJ1332806.1 hypothetical protein BSLG_008435 [Batrachochytrium salamandrivorans]
MQRVCDLLESAVVPTVAPAQQIRLFRESASILKKTSEYSDCDDELNNRFIAAVLQVVNVFFSLLGGSDRSVRTAALDFIQLAWSKATEGHREILNVSLQQAWSLVLSDSLIDTEALHTTSSRAMDSPQFAGLLISLLESPIMGRQLISSNIQATLSRLLDGFDIAHKAIRDAADANYNPNEQVIDATHYLLQSTIAVVSKLPVAVQRVDSTIIDRLMEKSLLLVNESFLTYANRILSGLLTATLIAYRIPADLPDWFIRIITQDDVASEKISKTEDATLIMLSGLLHVIQPQMLVSSIPGSDEQMIDVVYKRILKSIQSSNEPHIHILAFGTYARMFGVLKGLIKKDLLKDKTQRDSCKFLTRMCFRMILDRWEDPLAIIQHKLQDLSISILSMMCPGKKLLAEFESELDDIVKDLLSLGWHKKAKYDLLAIIMHEAPMRNSVIISNGVLSQSLTLLRNRIIGVSVINFVHQALLAEIDAKGTEWADLIIESMLLSDINDRKLVGERVIPKLAKVRPESLNQLVLALEKPVYQNNPLALYAKVAIWRSISNTGANSSSSIETDNEIQDILLQAIPHPDAELRFDALELLTSGHRTSQEIAPRTYATMKMFLEANMCVQSSDYRQRLLAQLQKILSRMKNVMYANFRQFETNMRILPSEDIAEANSKAAVHIALADEFILWLQVFAMSSIFPGASFQRVNLSLSVLKLMRQVASSPLDISASQVISQKVSVKFMPLISVDVAQTLFAKLAFDTYEGSRLGIIDYLATFTEPLPSMSSVEFSKNILDKALTMLRSLRAADIENGVFLILFLFKTNVQKYGQLMSIHEECTPLAVDHAINTPRNPTLFLLNELLNNLEHHLSIATDNIFVSSEKFPLNGVLSCLGHILNVCDLSNSNKSEWDALLSRMIDLCFQACQCTVDVCSDLSPEGNLPEAFSEIRKIEEDEGLANKVDKNGKTRADSASQIILRHCFRTIKGVAFVLETLICCSILPQTPDDSSSLLSYGQVQQIGDLFCSLLSQIRHRGAFSAVHASFTNIASRLLMGSSQDLAALPRKWLEEFMDQVTSVQVSITRRSAGLPFAVLALLSPPGPSQDFFLLYTIPRLCEIASQPIGPDHSQQIDHAQVHAFNILRTVFHDSELSHKVRQHLGACFILCIQQFSSPLFPIRNCAAMLFSSLLGKCFGVQKSKDDSDIINSTSSREFFAKFPQVYPVLLKQFEVAVVELEKGIVHPLLYPILTVLARLKSTPGSIEKGALFSLVPFGTLVRRCAGAKLWTIRELAARVTESLLPKSDALLLISEDAKSLKNCNVNYTHGLLLRARALLSRFSDQRTAADDLKAVFKVVFDMIRDFDVEWLLSSKQFVSAATVMEIASTFCFACDHAGVVWDAVENAEVISTIKELCMIANREISSPSHLQNSFRGHFVLVSVGMSCDMQTDLSASKLASLVHSSIPEVQREALNALSHGIYHLQFVPSKEHEMILVDLLGSIRLESDALAIASDIVQFLIRSERWKSSTELLACQSHFAASFHKPTIVAILKAWLPLLAANLAYAISTQDVGADGIALLFVEAAETITETGRPVQVSISLLESMQSLDWQCLFSVIDSAIANRLLCILDLYLGGESVELRALAASCIADIANNGASIAPLAARWRVRMEIVKRSATVESWQRALSFFTKPLLSSMDISSALAQQDQSARVLFDRENPNALFEEFGEAILSGESLMTAFATGRIPPDLTVALEKQLIEFVVPGVAMLNQVPDLLWATADPVLFSAVARVIVCVHVLKQMRPTSNDDFFTKDVCSNLHPLLSNLVGYPRGQKDSTIDQGWQLFRSIILGPRT